MDKRAENIYKGIIWGLLEMYLSNPVCDLDGSILEIHAGGRKEEYFVSYSGRGDSDPGIYGTCKLNPKFVERLNVTNAFAQCRDRGIISKSEYQFIKDKLTDVPVWRKYRIPMLAVDVEYNRIMHLATEAMVPILYPRQWAITKEQPREAAPLLV